MAAPRDRRKHTAMKDGWKRCRGVTEQDPSQRRDGSGSKAGSWSFAMQSSQSRMPSANLDPGRYPQGMRL